MSETPESRGPWWGIARVRVIDAAIAPALAFMFWAIMGVIVLFAVATAAQKGNPFTDFFTAFGALGQVFFAFMVWKLGRQQFDFIQTATVRQTRIDAFQLRHGALGELRAVFERFTTIRDPVDQLVTIILKIKTLFSAEIGKIADELQFSVIAYKDMEDMIGGIGDIPDDKTEDLRNFRAKHINEIAVNAMRLYRNAYMEMRINDSDGLEINAMSFRFDAIDKGNPDDRWQ